MGIITPLFSPKHANREDIGDANAKREEIGFCPLIGVRELRYVLVSIHNNYTGKRGLTRKTGRE